MSNPKEAQGTPWPEDPEAPDPTVVVQGWPELETALRKRVPEDQGPLPSEHVLVVYAGTHLGRVFPLSPGVNAWTGTVRLTSRGQHVVGDRRADQGAR